MNQQETSGGREDKTISELTCIGDDRERSSSDTTLANQEFALISKEEMASLSVNNDDEIDTINANKSLKLSTTNRDNSIRQYPSAEREICQGKPNETDDRLRQLSLRFSADANNMNLSGKPSLISAGCSEDTVSNMGANDSDNTKTHQPDRNNLGPEPADGFDIYTFEVEAPPTTSSWSEKRLDQVDLEEDAQSYELTELIERIAAAHKSTCGSLRTKAIDIGKRQSISSLPNIAGSQYCRYRDSPPHSNNQNSEQRSPSSSILNGSAGSSASSVSSGSSSGGSPMNNSQYITNSPGLSPNSNAANALISAPPHSSVLTPYQNHNHHQQHLFLNNGKQPDGSSGSKPANMKKPVDGRNELPSNVANVDNLEEYKVTLWQEYALLINPSIKQVVEFAKQVPGFLALNQLDQLLLIKSGFFEIWLVTIAGMFNCNDNTLTFSDGTYIDREQLDTMFDKSFSSFAFNFSISFNQLCLDDTEIGLVSAIILLQPSEYKVTLFQSNDERTHD